MHITQESSGLKHDSHNLYVLTCHLWLLWHENTKYFVPNLTLIWYKQVQVPIWMRHALNLIQWWIYLFVANIFIFTTSFLHVMVMNMRLLWDQVSSRKIATIKTYQINVVYAYHDILSYIPTNHCIRNKTAHTNFICLVMYVFV